MQRHGLLERGRDMKAIMKFLLVFNIIWTVFLIVVGFVMLLLGEVRTFVDTLAYLLGNYVLVFNVGLSFHYLKGWSK